MRLSLVAMGVVALIALAYAEKLGNGSIFSFVRGAVETSTGIVSDGAAQIADRYSKTPEVQEQLARVEASKAPPAQAASTPVNLNITFSGNGWEGAIPKVDVTAGTASVTRDSGNNSGS
jgi:hypothetical protein